MGTKREVKKSWRSLPSQWHHHGDAKSNREREGGERTSTAERGETHMGTKREGKKAWRS